MSSVEARERAAAGASLLDRKYPEWWEKVELEILDVGSVYNCPLGQLYGEYGRGLEELGFGGDSWWDRERRRELYGFDAGYSEETDEYVDYEDLREAWIDEIEDRYF